MGDDDDDEDEEEEGEEEEDEGDDWRKVCILKFDIIIRSFVELVMTKTSRAYLLLDELLIPEDDRIKQGSFNTAQHR